MPGPTTDSFCAKCIYYGRSTETCDYILIEDRSRPCPPGPGCVVRRTKKGGGNIKKPKWDTELGRLLWLDGRKDSEIADEFGIATSVVTSYRKRHWEKGTAKPFINDAKQTTDPEETPEESTEVLCVEEVHQAESVELTELRQMVDDLEERNIRLDSELNATREERAYWKRMYEEAMIRMESPQSGCEPYPQERLKRIETMNASLKEENLILRHQIDIVYLIFGNRHVEGLHADT